MVAPGAGPQSVNGYNSAEHIIDTISALATKKILTLSQREDWGPISVRFDIGA